MRYGWRSTASAGTLPAVRFEESGWLLVRAVADHPKTFRFASTGPYYVEIGDRPRISRESAEFFRHWIDQRIAGLKLDEPQQRTEVMAYLDRARRFWVDKVREANAP